MTTPAAEPPQPHRATVVEWVIEHWPTTTRRRVAIVLAVLAIFVATFVASSKLLRLVFDELDILAYAGLFVTCWVGAGGAIVPIPGVRLVSWLMIIQQGAALDLPIVVLVAASAMVLGQTSYFLAARAAVHRVEQHEEEAEAETAPTDTPEEIPSRRARYLADLEHRVRLQIREHGTSTVMLVCALPTPVTTITTTAAATSGMSYPRFALAAFSGFLILSGVLALVGEGLLAGIRSLIG